MAADVGLNFRDRTQDNTRSGFEKREKRRRIRKLQDAISQKKNDLVKELLQEDFDVDFQYRGQTALQLAVREGLYDICKSLIEKGADVNKTDSDMNNLLNMACWRDYERIADLLIHNNADIDAQNDHGCTPLNTCAYKGCTNISHQLLSAKCDPNIPNSHGRTPLHTAAKQRHIDIIEILQKCGCNLNIGDEDLKTPLCIAAELGYADVVKCLLSGGADPDIQDKGKRTAVYNAAVQGHLEVIRELVQGKADVNIATTKGSTPLLEAINNNFMEVAELLIDSKCNIDQRDRLHQAPVHAAIRQVSQVFGPETEKALSLVKKILESGCDVNLADNQGWSPLYQAAFAGNQEITRMLLDRKADVNLKTKNGGTVLHAGTMGNNPIVVDMLIRAGSDVIETNDNQESPLFCAVASRANMQILELLLKAGSNLDIQEKTQQLTPLHEAVIQHYTKAAMYFIDSGCDVNAVNSKFQTALYLAAEKGNDLILERILREPKCPVNGTKPTAIPLHIAAVNNHAKIAQILIKNNCSINKMNEKCLTPIMHATQENSPNVAKVLLKYGCDLNAHAKIKRVLPCCLMNEDPHPHFGLEPIFLAVTHKNLDLVKLYLKCYYKIPFSVVKNLSNILRTSRDMNTQFSQSQKRDFLEVFEKSLRYPRSLQEICRLEIREWLGGRPEVKVQGLPVAKKLQDYILMTETFEEDADLEPTIEERKTGRFGMISNVKRKRREKQGKAQSFIRLTQMVQWWAPRSLWDLLFIVCITMNNKMNEKCLTPIMHATQENSPNVAKVLLKYGCDLNAHAKIKRVLPCCLMNEDPHPHFGLEPIFLAVTHKNLDLVKLYLKCYYKIPFSVVKNLSNILRTSRDMNTQFSQSQKRDFLEVFEKSLRYPRSLQEICRLEIREWLGGRPEVKVQGLPVAKKLQDYILMTETFEEDADLEPTIEERKTGRFGMISNV